jgi:pimeloyl-ACP methyl ester carboxylesterase
MENKWYLFGRYLFLEIGCFFLKSLYSVVGFTALATRFLKNGMKMFEKKEHKKPECLEGWKHGYLQLAEIKMHYVEDGDPSNPLMLFVHGFPEYWYSWRHQIKYFAKNYHVVAIDMRGYGQSDKPEGIDAYDIKFLIKDLVEATMALGHTNSILVAHDWGALVAWMLALVHPEFIDKLIILNVPHPDSFVKQLSTNLKQFLCSWYMFFFQAPYLPEAFFETLDYSALIDSFKSLMVNPENFTDEDAEAWKYTFSQSGCSLTEPINYYRAAKRRLCTAPLGIDIKLVERKTLIIWGEKDAALCIEGAMDSVTRCKEAKLIRIPNASHFVQQDTPELVNKYIEEFLNE